MRRHTTLLVTVLAGMFSAGCSHDDGLTREDRAALMKQMSDQTHQMAMAMIPPQTAQTGPYTLEASADGRVVLVVRSGDQPQRYLIDMEQKRLVPMNPTSRPADAK